MALDLKHLKKIFIIAEISANHGQDINRAISLIKEAKKCGADAVKFQIYKPDSITLNSNNKYFKIRHSKWKGNTLYSLYRKAYTPWEWFRRLKKTADKENIIFFASAFDKAGVDLLEELNVPFHKIASFEIVDLPLISYMAATKKPVILSTGMATTSEIKEAVNTAKKKGAKQVALLKCVSDYPAKPEEVNLKSIERLRNIFKCPVGLSDHTLGYGIPIAAACFGARIIEKHFTLSRKIKTPDSFFSIEPDELKTLTSEIRAVEKSLRRTDYRMAKSEMKNRIFRRSLFAVKDIKKGEIFTEENVKSIRPGYGLLPKYSDTLIGKKSKKKVFKGTPIRKDMF